MSAGKGGFVELSLLEDADAPKLSVFSVKKNKKVLSDLLLKQKADQEYIKLLVNLLKENNLPIPEFPYVITDKESESTPLLGKPSERGLKDASVSSVHEWMARVTKVVNIHRVDIQYKDLNYYTFAPKLTIPTVGSTIRKLLFGAGKKEKIDIIKGITGRILPGKMTLVMGPPGTGLWNTYSVLHVSLIIIGSGKSTFLKALAGQLLVNSNTFLDGSISYNSQQQTNDKFLVPKLVKYCNEDDVHHAVMTVRETLEFSWMCNNGGHHAYSVATDEATIKHLNSADSERVIVKNILKVLGLDVCADTVVGMT